MAHELHIQLQLNDVLVQELKNQNTRTYTLSRRVPKQKKDKDIRSSIAKGVQSRLSTPRLPILYWPEVTVFYNTGGLEFLLETPSYQR